MVEDSILYYQSMKESILQRQPSTKLPFMLTQSLVGILTSCQSVEESLESILMLHQIPIVWVPVCRSCRRRHSVPVPLREHENITYITWNLKIITIRIVLQWFSDYSCLQNRWDEFQTWNLKIIIRKTRQLSMLTSRLQDRWCDLLNCGGYLKRDSILLCTI